MSAGAWVAVSVAAVLIVVLLVMGTLCVRYLAAVLIRIPRNPVPHRAPGAPHEAKHRLRLRRADGSRDWAVSALIAAGALIVVGVAMFAAMFANRDYWRADPTMPSVFVMFSKVINYSTVGVICVFAGLVIAASALLYWFIRAGHERIEARLDESADRAHQLMLGQTALIDLVAENTKRILEHSRDEADLKELGIGLRDLVISNQLNLADLFRLLSERAELDQDIRQCTAYIRSQQQRSPVRPRRKRRPARERTVSQGPGGDGRVIPFVPPGGGTPAPPSPPDNVVQMPSPQTMDALRKIAKKIVGDAERGD